MCTKISVVWGSAIAMVTLHLFSITNAQSQETSIDLFVDDPRPVAKAVDMLISKYPVVVTYEDPRYEYHGDIRDVTLEVRRDLHLYDDPSKAPRVLVPAGGVFDVSYSGLPETGEPIDWDETLNAIINTHEVSDSGGRFAIERVGDVLHVKPTQTKNPNGLWVEQASILDTIVSIAAEKLNGLEMLVAICEALSEATGQSVVIGTSPLNPFFHHEGVFQANHERAREVLQRTLHSVNDYLTWKLLYDPVAAQYALNIGYAGYAAFPTTRSPAATYGLSSRSPRSELSSGTPRVQPSRVTPTTRRRNAGQERE